jgi:hypothetical protein
MAKDQTEVIVDRALESVGMPARKDGETVSDYLDRKDFGPNARGYLGNMAAAALAFDSVQANAAAHSARAHFDNPNPPDSKPLKP